MYTVRQYNVLRVDFLPLKKQYENIKVVFGDRLISRPVLLKDDKRYITFFVRV